ncbi:hypothetical protein HPHPP11_0236 [Helicobacter pylori Hp P-11]|nr:hypothetical protein HPHPP11_0236 [Helicobacter pylori Hp P-11]
MLGYKAPCWAIKDFVKLMFFYFVFLWNVLFMFYLWNVLFMFYLWNVFNFN